ncbi:16449_t:CDS:2, partial [Racocetra persica]
KPYIIASLNPNISKISHNMWYAAPNSTNCAEAAHAMSNREGKQLKLMTAIIRIDIKANYNVNISGQDKGGIARKKLAIKRSTKRQSKASSSTKRQNKDILIT